MDNNVTTEPPRYVNVTLRPI